MKPTVSMPPGTGVVLYCGCKAKTSSEVMTLRYDHTVKIVYSHLCHIHKEDHHMSQEYFPAQAGFVLYKPKHPIVVGQEDQIWLVMIDKIDDPLAVALEDQFSAE